MRYGILALILFIFIAPLAASAAPLTPGDILITTNRFDAPNNAVFEYSQSGQLVESWLVPFPGLDSTAGDARAVAVSPDVSTIYVYNGNIPAYITTITPSTGATGQQQATNLGTANVVWASDLAATSQYLFAGPANGIVRFNTADFSYQTFLTGESVDKPSIGADGNLYILNTDEDVGWPGVEVYNPTTMSLIRSFAFVGGGFNGVTGDQFGNVYDIAGTSVYKYSPTGTLLTTLNTPYDIEDIKITPSGQILLGGYGAWMLTNESLSLNSVQYFPTPDGGPVFVSFVSSPEPASLSLLALSSVPLLLRRKRTM